MIQSPESERRLAELARGKDSRRWCEVCTAEFRDIRIGEKTIHGCIRCWKGKGYKGWPPQHAANHGFEAAKPTRALLEPLAAAAAAGGDVHGSISRTGARRKSYPQQQEDTLKREVPTPQRHAKHRTTGGLTLPERSNKRVPSIPPAGAEGGRPWGQQSLPALTGNPMGTPQLHASHVDEERTSWVQGKLNVKPFVQQAVGRLVKELHATELTPQQLFEKIDQNGDGELSRAEMQYMLRKLGITLTPVELDAVLRAFDTDGNGTVDFEEFQAMMRLYEDRMPKAEPLKHVSALFGFDVGDRVRANIRLLPSDQVKSRPDLSDHADGTVVGPGHRDGTISVRFDTSGQNYSVMPSHIHKLAAHGDKTVERAGSFRNARRKFTF